MASPSVDGELLDRINRLESAVEELRDELRDALRDQEELRDMVSDHSHTIPEYAIPEHVIPEYTTDPTNTNFQAGFVDATQNL
tara:strand:+ start:1313 stop:1561 length:249 start_codon:yes stop_codon:yes gene_type:complete